MSLTEDALVEQPALQLLSQLGWEPASGFNEVLGPAGTLGRDSQTQVVLIHRLRNALRGLNPGAPDEAIGKAIDVLLANRSLMHPVRANRDIYKLLRDGTKIEVQATDGTTDIVTVRYMNWDSVHTNDWFAVSQFWVTGEMYKRRADLVLFVNGIPLVFIELKVSHKDVRNAYYDNLRDYRDTIPQVFWFNAFVILSNGSDTRVGSTYAPWDNFGEWKKINSEGDEGIVSLETALRGTCERHRLLDLVENFIAYSERPGGLVKALARNHQYLGVNNAIQAFRELKERHGRLGVFWHTQGSGKTLSNLWFTQKVLRKIPGNWTFVEVTDRKELDDQIYKEFVDAGVITAGDSVHAETSQHLQVLLGQDHRYIFTLIHKFRPPETGAEMPVLSDRSDIVVITDEAHRTQYDVLAGNMRRALPNASFLGFTGTPLIAGEEELTRQVFGDYVSIYNFRDSIEDGATVALYYENRIPELQLTNEDFDEDLEQLLDEAALDPDQEKAVSRQFSRQYHLITRVQRLDEIAGDLVRHFVGRGFRGKAMYVAIDKATAVRMYNLVRAHWVSYVAELEMTIASTPPLERPPLEAQLQFMRTTDMAVVVSQAQNEISDMAQLGLDMAPHRKRMNEEDLDSKFKDANDSFRLVFVCAMWLTGFDAPSCSTIYLDKPMRNHTLMQTIARANRVFPDKDSALIVDYIGVFRNLEKALAVYGASRYIEGGSPIEPKEKLVANLEEALTQAIDFLQVNDIDLRDLEIAKGFEFVALQKSAVEALLIDDATRRRFIALANQVRAAFKALLPDPEALRATHRVAVIRTIAAKLQSSTEAPDISSIMDSVNALLDRSVGTDEYIIRMGADAASPLVDLNQLDFEQLALRFAGNKRTAARKIEENLGRRLDAAVRKNPTRLDLADRFRRLIDEYNSGTHTLEEFLRRLKLINDELATEEKRTLQEDLSEAELAVFDLLTRPGPELTDIERAQVRNTAKDLIENVTQKLVLDWRKRQQTRAAIQTTVNQVLDEGLPEVYGPEVYDEKCQKVFEHVYASYFDNGDNVYSGVVSEVPPVVPVGSTLTEDTVLTDELIIQAKSNPRLLAQILEQLFGTRDTWFRTTEELLAADETRTVEYKQTARWNVKGKKKDKTMEQVIVKAVAGFLNGRGGTLLIGVTDDGRPVGLSDDYSLVTPSNADGYVAWLDTLLENALGHAGAHRVDIRIDVITGLDVCRIDIPASSRPIWTKIKDGAEVLYERRNNSTRAVPVQELDAFLDERFPKAAREE